jgi:hypothetical protein
MKQAAVIHSGGVLECWSVDVLRHPTPSLHCSALRFLQVFLLSLSLCAAVARAAPTNALAVFLETHCYDCHDGSTKKGGLDLEGLVTKPDANLNPVALMAKWERIHDRVRDGEMPPKKKTPPPPAARNSFLQTLASSLTKSHATIKGTVMRRLNRLEYERTLNQLLGTRVEVADMLPEDGKAHGFDNIGDALDLSPTQLQRYMEAAGLALDAAVALGPRPAVKTETFTFDTGRNEQYIGKQWLKRPDGAVVFFSEGNFPAIKPDNIRIARAGRYRVRIHTAAHQSDKALTYRLFVGRDFFDSMPLYGEFQAAPGAIAVQELELLLRANETIRFRPNLNRFLKYKEDPATFDGPGLAIQKVEIEGPFHDEWPPRGHKLRFGDLSSEDAGPANQRGKSWYRPQYKLTSTSPEADLARVLPPFIEAAFRRPVSGDVTAPFIALARAELATGATLEQALRTAQVAVLCAPDFLYLLEPAGRLDDYALAARLSYMLWGLPPDAELLALAARRQLSKPATLRSQTERLLADARSHQFTENFTGQWLNLRDIDFTVPDKQLYPEYDESLKLAMVRETELFFAEVLKNNLRALNFVDSNWTFVNERLARHYRIDGVTGSQLRKIPLKPEHRRGGVLTHASVLKVSANGTTTSPVVRGAFVLERILGIQPPPPPPGVPGVEPDIRGATTLREQLEKHRTQESCNGCHRLIDPPGFALESYDVMGGWRENYRSLGKDFPKPPAGQTDGRNVQWRIGPPVDATGQTKDGKPFKDLADYKAIVLAQPRQFTRALAGKLAIYATGRGMGFSDRAELDRITTAVAAKKNGFRDLIHEVVQSEIFRSK